MTLFMVLTLVALAAGDFIFASSCSRLRMIELARDGDIFSYWRFCDVIYLPSISYPPFMPYSAIYFLSIASCSSNICMSIESCVR